MKAQIGPYFWFSAVSRAPGGCHVDHGACADDDHEVGSLVACPNRPAVCPEVSIRMHGVVPLLVPVERTLATKILNLKLLDRGGLLLYTAYQLY